jgi:hypothetical protein
MIVNVVSGVSIFQEGHNNEGPVIENIGTKKLWQCGSVVRQENGKIKLTEDMRV